MKIGKVEVTGISSNKSRVNGAFVIRSSVTLQEIGKGLRDNFDYDEEGFGNGDSSFLAPAMLYTITVPADKLKDFIVGKRFEMELTEMKEEPIGISGT